MYISNAKWHSFHIMKFLEPKLTPDELNRRIKAYFTYIEGEYHIETAPPGGKTRPRKNARIDTEAGEVIVYTREPEPPTLTGLALFIGFNSREEFEAYEKKPRFAVFLKRARLKIEAEYEKKLPLTSAAGAIFALKSLGWNDEKETANPALKTLEIKILESGPALSQTEKEVIL